MKVIFEDERLLVADKPSGLVVNRSKTIKEDTFQDQVSDYLHLQKGDLGIGDRAGITHRLDRETSGLLVIAKTNAAFDFLQNEFSNRMVKKVYFALVHGLVRADSGEVESMIGRIGKFGRFGNLQRRQEGGKDAQTRYAVVTRFNFDQKRFDLMLGGLAKKLSKALEHAEKIIEKIKEVPEQVGNVAAPAAFEHKA